MSNKNPYSQAADAYGATAAETDQRALEGRALLKAAAKLETLSQRIAAKENVTLEDIGDTLDFNRKLWTVFVTEALNPDHPLPQEIKNNIASLGVFVFKRTTDIFVDPVPEKIKVLIDINRNIASGLMKQAALSANAKPPAAPADKAKAATSTDSMV